MVIHLFTVFVSTFDMDQSGVRRHHRQERLTISKIAKYKSDTS